MKVLKLKATKYSDLLVVGDAGGPSVVTIATRLKATDHGVFFRDLIMKVAPEAYNALCDAPVASPDEATMMRRNCALAVADFCEALTMAAIDRMQDNKALGVPVPSYESLLDRLKDEGQEPVSADVLSLVPRHEESQDGS